MKFLDKKILIFDVDGVLVDSKTNMRLSWKSVQKKYSLNHIKFDEYFKNIGRPFFEILNKIGVEDKYNKIKNTYQKESMKQVNNINYFPNTIKTIKKLKEKKFNLNIVTSKDSKRTKIFLKEIKEYFTIIECNNDSKKGKPNPDQINFIISKSKAKKSECVYIGDTHVDYETSQNSNIDFIFAKWGYGKNYNYKQKCSKPIDLIKIF